MNKQGSYTKKTSIIFYIFILLLTFFIIQILYLSSTKIVGDNALSKKVTFVRMSGLPDLAISTESYYVRHRSLSGMFSIYKDDSSLREYFPSTYAISHSHIINNQDIKSTNEKQN